jgi:hypothetical protein
MSNQKGLKQILIEGVEMVAVSLVMKKGEKELERKKK